MAKHPPLTSDDLGLNWTAHEYLEHERGIGWFLGFGLIMILLAGVVYFISGRDLIAPLSIVLVAICLGVFVLKKPKQRQYRLLADGIKVDQALHPYDGFIRFNVFNSGSLTGVHLIPSRRWSVPLTLYVPQEIAEEVVDHLSHVVVYDDSPQSTLDQLLHQLRF